MSGADRSEAARWFAYAEDDLRGAEILRREGAATRQACFLAQQAAEKALKAVLLSLGIEFAKTHDLIALRRLLPGAIAATPSDEKLAELTQWGTQARYPGDFPEARDEDVDRALAGAQEILRWAAQVSDLK